MPLDIYRYERPFPHLSGRVIIRCALPLLHDWELLGLLMGSHRQWHACFSGAFLERTKRFRLYIL